MITWDETKRQTNIAKHGYDFVGIESIFDAPVVGWEDTRESYGEQRICLLGWLHGKVVHLSYVDNGESIRVFSLRKAEKHEVRFYEKHITG